MSVFKLIPGALPFDCGFLPVFQQIVAAPDNPYSITQKTQKQKSPGVIQPQTSQAIQGSVYQNQFNIIQLDLSRPFSFSKLFRLKQKIEQHIDGKNQRIQHEHFLNPATVPCMPDQKADCRYICQC